MRNGLEIIKINRKISFNYYLNDEIIVKGDISNGCLWNFETYYNQISLQQLNVSLYNIFKI